MLRTIGRKILLQPQVKNLLGVIVEFYNNQPVTPDDVFKPKILGQSPQFHAGSVMPFNTQDSLALSKVVQMVLKPGIMVAEIGSWTGASTSVLAKSVAKYDGKVYCVDTWKGNDTVPEYNITSQYDIFSIFRFNMMVQGLSDIVHPMPMPSMEAVKVIKDGTFDLVFIDADHRYKYVKDDILAWLPKVKPGGIICGHDCEFFYSEQSPDIQKSIDAHLADDCITGLCHPGVVKALNEIFKDSHKIMSPGIVWWKKV